MPACSADVLDDLICRLVGGERIDLEPNEAAAVSTRAKFQGMHNLLFAAAAKTGSARLFDSTKQDAIEQAAWEMHHQQVMEAALKALDDKGVRPITFKGTALAYTLYDDPSCRPRGDTDMLVPMSQRRLAGEALEAVGFRRNEASSGELASYQATYTLQDGTTTHSIDLHWKINNSQVLAGLFKYEELKRDAGPIEKLSPLALGPSGIDSFLIACMHRCTHENNPYYTDGVAAHDPDRLIWLYDIDQLARRMSPRDWTSALARATEKQLVAVVTEGLQASQRRFGTPWPRERWMDAARQHAPERPHVYFGKGQIGRYWIDFTALHGAARLKWMAELLFPSPRYMRVKYATARLSWMPWLYLRRAFGGVFKIARASGPGR